MSLLSGRVVCVTGSSRSIGRACAVECPKYGAAGLILHYFGDPETKAEVEAPIDEIYTAYLSTQALAVPGDIGDSETSKKVCSAT